MIITLKIFAFILIATYVLYILWMYKALLIAQKKQNEICYDRLKISVIIAFRNEESHIINCIESLKNQTYSKQDFEIILCNDHSTDNSSELVREYISEHPQLKIRLIENNQLEQGKKQAIANAVKQAQYDILAFTDADCVVENNWLKSIASAYLKNNQFKMLCGPVIFQKQNSLLEKLLSLEFASLMAVTAASIFNKNPFMCNAANMSIKKDVYLLIQKKLYEIKYASGDDVFLLHHVKKKFGSNSISFMYQKEALVHTLAPQNIRSFINQRIRWSSKTLGYNDEIALFSAFLVFITCTTIASGLIISFFYEKLVSLFIAFFLIKTLADALLLHQILKLLQRKELLKWIFIEQLLYVFYVPIIALISLKKTYTWKGRRIR